MNWRENGMSQSEAGISFLFFYPYLLDNNDWEWENVHPLFSLILNRPGFTHDNSRP